MDEATRKLYADRGLGGRQGAGTRPALVVVDLNDPKCPRVVSVTGAPFLKCPKAIQVQFRYCYVCDEEGIKVLDVTHLDRPVPVYGRLARIYYNHQPAVELLEVVAPE